MTKDDYLLMAEIMIKLTSIERMLIKNKVVDQDELIAEMKKVSEEVAAKIALQTKGLLK